jgi:hypothetical protein
VKGCDIGHEVYEHGFRYALRHQDKGVLGSVINKETYE